jgi:hypothetical protein
VVNGEHPKPLFGLEGLSTNRAFYMPDGSVRLLATEIGLFTDLQTGKVIERWRNPYLNEEVDVWHVRNGPINLHLDPRKPPSAAGGWKSLRKSPYDDGTGFFVPTQIVGDRVIITTDFQAKRKNPLDPKQWPRESVGEFLQYSEHNTSEAGLAELQDPKVRSVNARSAWHSFLQWWPWMLMGQRPGRVYHHLVPFKVASWDEVEPHLIGYARERFPELLSAPKEWTGAYRDNWTFFKEQRKPVPLR